jgi:hypothetical protein
MQRLRNGIKAKSKVVAYVLTAKFAKLKRRTYTEITEDHRGH